MNAEAVTLPSLDVLVRLGSAVACGGIIGMNRFLRHKASDMRTHALVSMGAAILMIALEQYGGPGSRDAVSRGVQGVVQGIGFLGAGVILHRGEGSIVQGINTAASLWVTACLGVACGIGQWALALFATLLAMVILVPGRVLEERIARRRARNEEAPPG